MLDYAIVIPSWKRAERIRTATGNHTLAYIDRSLGDKIHIASRDEDAEEYAEVSDQYGLANGIRIPDNVKNGIVGTRDIILDWAVACGIEKLIMMDDDLQLCVKPDAKTYKTMINGVGFKDMIDDLLIWTSDEYPVVGITARQFSSDKTTKFDKNTRIIQVFSLHIPTIQKEDMSFGQFGLEFMTDYAFILEMLQRGYKNVCLNTYCRNDVSQAPGGCAEYRTVEKASKSAIALSKLYPELVKPYVKTTGSWDEKRINVRVAWKKAYKGRFE